MTEKDNEAFDESKRPHRKRQAGPKREKKKAKSDAEKNVVKPKNPKAYSFHSIKKTERAVRRTADHGERKLHRPVVHRLTDHPPPVLVAVVGPPQVGKTTLIRCLVKNFTGKNVLTIKGPITIVTSKKLRVTFIECNNDLNSMIDLSKSADLVLLMSNAKRGFEMEVFEFVNLVEAHGKMRTMGILTHIDQVKNSKLIQKREQFWKKSIPKAKLFKLSKIIEDEYQRKEIENLGRFIEVMKYEPIEWRTTHPYVLVDRLEDMTDPEELKKNDKLDRTVCMYGYVRGTNFEKNSGVHVLGVGDFTMDEMSHMPDPCPFPWEHKRRSLNKQERLVYAPFSGVGGVLMDKDAVYIETATIQSLNQKRRLTEKDKLLQTFNNVDSDGDEEIDQAVFDDDDEEEEEEDMCDDDAMVDDDQEEGESEGDGDGDEEDDENNLSQESMEVDDDDDDDDEEGDSGDGFMGDHLFDNEEEDDDDDEDGENTDKKAKLQVENMRKGIHTFLERHKKDGNIQRLIYDYDPMAEEEEEEQGGSLVDGLFKVAKATRKGKLAGQVETSVKQINVNDFKQDDISRLLESMRDRIKVKGEGDEDDDDEGDVDLGDDDGFGGDDDSDCDDDDNDDDEGSEEGVEEEKKDPMDDDYVEPETPKERRKRRREEKIQERKRRQKELFDSMYDDENPGKKNHFEMLKEEMAQQSQMNMSAFGELNEEARTQFEGFRPGLYVRIQVRNFPSEFVKHFDPSYPLVVGGLLNQERNVGYVTVSLNKHRWYKGMLKTDDPITFSLGWRRFQTIPIYSRRDDNGRNRRVKAIQGIGFQATFWGPLTPQATGIAAVGIRSVDKKEFRLSASGVVREVDQAPTIQKKLKLCGEPILVHRNTAFIEKMFNSDLEVAKFQSAQIKTVSGIRGQIKKSVQNGSTLLKKLNIKRDIMPGCFRATFEDKIKISDIVFLTAWVKAPVEQFYNPISNLLLPLEERGEWKGMRTSWEVRKDRGIQRDPEEKSLYKDIHRSAVKHTELKIPKALMRDLPFEFKPKEDAKVIDNVKRVAVIKDPKERKVDQMIKELKAIYDQKRKDKRVEMRERAIAHKRQIEVREKKKGIKRKSKK